MPHVTVSKTAIHFPRLNDPPDDLMSPKKPTPFVLWHSKHRSSRHRSFNYPYFGRNTGKAPVRVPTHYSVPQRYVSNGALYIHYTLSAAPVLRMLQHHFRCRLPGVRIFTEGVTGPQRFQVYYQPSPIQPSHQLLSFPLPTLGVFFTAAAQNMFEFIA